jgi:thiol-disulfide isomerase/thioredoxin
MGERTRQRTAVAVTVLVVAIVLGPPAASVSDPADPPADLLLQPFPEPVPLPALVLTELDGRPFPVSQLHGKTVLLNFWATWCVPCRAEMPALDALHRAYRRRGFLVLAVNFKEPAPDVRRFVQSLGVSFPIALDADGEMSRVLKVRGLPVSYLLDRDGRLIWKAIGTREWNAAEVHAYLDRLLPPPRS